MHATSLPKVVFGVSVIVVACWYLTSLIESAPSAVVQDIIKFPLWVFILALTLSAIGGLINAWAWLHILRFYDRTTRFPQSYWAWSVGRVFRYIPGKVLGYLVRYKLQSIELNRNIWASVNELCLLGITISFLTSIYLIFFPESGSLILLVGCFLIFLLLFFSKELIRKINGNRFKWLASADKYLMPPMEISKNSLLIFVAVLVHGASFYIILNQDGGLTLHGYLTATVVLYLSGILGQISLISPAGLGVREAALTFILVQNGVDGYQAVIVALISRLVLLFSEVANVLLAWIVKLRY